MFPDEEEKPKVQKGGSQFADVSAYLSANKPQAQRLASQVGQNVVNAGNQARQAAQPIQQKFNEQVQANTVPYNQAIAQKAQQDPRSFFQGYQPIQQAPTNAKDWQSMRKAANQQISGGNKFGNMAQYLSQNKKGGIPIVAPHDATPESAPITPTSPDDLAAFQAMRDANYQGPESLSQDAGYGNALDLQNTAAGMTSDVGNDVGREDLLKGFYEGSKGGSALDQMLLGGGEAKPILDQSAKENADLPGALEKANDASMVQADAARQTDEDTRNKIAQGMLGEGGALQGLQSQRDQLGNKAGGAPWKRMQYQTQQADLNQRLDALNRLMNTQYNYGG